MYIDAPLRIDSDYNVEREHIADYRGREILELLQNAVDELDDGPNADIEISLRGSVLRVCNNGKVFTLNGFRSLIYSNLSPKQKKDNYIGNKGTGFRSVLNWAKEVRVYSGDLNVEFSDVRAANFLSELRAVPSVGSYCEGREKNNYVVRLPTLAAPFLIDKPDNLFFDTVIEIALKENMEEKVSAQLQDITPQTLLFFAKD